MKPITVVRVIARLNIGGPAIHSLLLTAGLNHGAFRSTLVTGIPGDDEGNMTYLAGEHGITPFVIPELGWKISWAWARRTVG